MLNVRSVGVQQVQALIQGIPSPDSGLIDFAEMVSMQARVWSVCLPVQSACIHRRQMRARKNLLAVDPEIDAVRLARLGPVVVNIRRA